MSIEVTTPVGVALLVVLVLFVVLVLLWRRKGRTPPATESEPDDKEAQELPEPSDQRPARYSRLVLGHLDEPSAVIEPLELPVESLPSPLPVNKQQLIQLQTILRHAPGLAKSVSTATTNTYTLRFPPEVAKGIRDGSLNTMKAGGGLRGVVLDTQGKIVSQATLIPASHLNMAAVAAGVFQVLAIATAQYYLPQINSRLQQVEQRIQDIQSHLEVQDKAILVDSLEQLRSMKRLLERGDLQERDDVLASHIGLDTIDRDSGRVLRAYLEHMKRYRGGFDGLKLSGVFNPDFAAATDKAAQYQKAALIALQAMYVKSVNAQFRCAIAGNYSRIAQAHHSLQELEKDLEVWYKDQASFTRRFKERIRQDTTVSVDLTELFDDDDTLENQRKRIVSEANDRQELILVPHYELQQAISNAADNAARQLSTSSEPLTLTVKLSEQGEIEQVYELAGELQSPRR